MPTSIAPYRLLARRRWTDAAAIALANSGVSGQVAKHHARLPPYVLDVVTAEGVALFGSYMLRRYSFCAGFVTVSASPPTLHQHVRGLIF